MGSLVLKNGRIFTGRRFVDSLAIHDGVVGDGSGTVIDLRGRLAIPGFHDAHTHLLGAGLTQEELSLEGARSPKECAARVATRTRESWIVGRGWDSDIFPGGAWPHRRDLDAVAPRTPVFLLRRDGHAAWANGRALELAGIAKGVADPPHGEILRDSSGEPTGVLLEEPAIALVRRIVPSPDLATRVRAAQRGLELARRNGVTSIQDDASYDDRLKPGDVYAHILEKKELTARVTLWQRLGRSVDELREERAAMPRSDRLRFGLLKGYLDGSLGSRTAHLFEPYCDCAPKNTGIPLIAPEALGERVREAHVAGFQVGLHAIGDRASAHALDALATLGDARARRHRIEHVQVLRAEDVKRFADMGVVASVQPVHLSSDMRIAPARLGERCRTSYPWRALLDAGAALAFGTDYPVESIDPLRGLYCAVARRSPDRRDEVSFFPEQGVTLQEALAAYTTGAAFASHEERLGFLEPGFHGDVAVLSQDIFAIPVDGLPDVRVDVTIVGGDVVFSRD